jgi:exosortase D (VPLPA-CTERM-specific)
MRFVIYAALAVIVYQSALTQLIYSDWGKEDYSHCPLVPLIVLYLVWEKRHELKALHSKVSWSGLVPFLFGLVLFWLGELGSEYFTLYVSFWLVIVGLLWLHIGWQKIKLIWFALAMILTMFPLPNILNVRLTFGLKLISSQLGVWMLHVYGMSAYREGNVIDLGFTQLQVVDACSGLRYVIPLMVLALLLAYWFKAHIWKRTVIVLSSIPIAIVVNSLRIAVTGILYSAFGAKVAEGFFHGFSGWLIFMGTIPVLLAEMYLLRRLPPRETGAVSGQRSAVSGKDRGTRDDSATPQPIEPIRPTEPIKQPFLKQLLQPVFIVAIVLLGATLVLSKTVEFRERIPIKKPLRELPAQIGEWKGDRTQMEQQFIDALHFSDYAIVDYKNPQGKSVNFYTAYYESQRKGEATHSPETCLPGSGWIFRETGTVSIRLADGKAIRVNRAFMEKSGVRELSYYWFAMRGRVLTNLYQVKFYTFWNALTKHRTDGALVRLITPVYDSEPLSTADERLQSFTQLIGPILKEYIPE